MGDVAAMEAMVSLDIEAVLAARVVRRRQAGVVVLGALEAGLAEVCDLSPRAGATAGWCQWRTGS